MNTKESTIAKQIYPIGMMIMRVVCMYELEEEKELNKPPVTVSLFAELPRETVERLFFGEG